MRTEVTIGYVVRGHVDHAAMLSAVLTKSPSLRIHPGCEQWLGRWLAHGDGRPVTPRAPTLADVHRLWWRLRSGAYARARRGSRGSFAVTYLPVEACDTLLDVFDEERKRWEWTGHGEADTRHLEG